MILLDTNVVSEMMKAVPEPDVIRWLDDQVATDVFISSITKAEIELGIGMLPDGKRKKALENAACSVFDEFESRCLAFNCFVSTHYSQIVAQNTRSGHPISVEDAQIAAISLSHDCLLATRNTKDFDAILELKLFNPWQPDKP